MVWGFRRYPVLLSSSRCKATIFRYLILSVLPFKRVRHSREGRTLSLGPGGLARSPCALARRLLPLAPRGAARRGRRRALRF